MFKKISTILLGAVIITLCGAFLPQGKAEAGKVTHYIKHNYGNEWGQTAISTSFRTFWTDWKGEATVSMGWIKGGIYRAVAIMRCGGYGYNPRVYVPNQGEVKVYFRFPHIYK